MQVFSKSTKLPVHRSSKIPVRYKRNAITGELNRVKQIAPDFNKELKRIRQKYRNARFSLKSINETICNFERRKEEMIIPEWLFEKLMENMMKEKLFQLSSHALLRMRNLVKYLREKSKISLMTFMYSF